MAVPHNHRTTDWRDGTYAEARAPAFLPCAPRTPCCTLLYAACWWWAPCACNPRVSRVYCSDLLKYWIRPRLGRLLCGGFPWLSLPLVFILVGVFVGYPRAERNWGRVEGGCTVHIHHDQLTRSTFTACDSKESCHRNPLTRTNKTHGDANVLCEHACPLWDTIDAANQGSWQKCWGNCRENGFKKAFSDANARERQDVPILEQITVKYVPYTITFRVPTQAEADDSGFSALREMRPNLAGIRVNITGQFGQLDSDKDRTFIRFERGGGKDVGGPVVGSTYEAEVGGTRCYTEDYWWLDSAFDMDWQEFGAQFGAGVDYTSSYCNPGVSVPGWAPKFSPDAVLDNLVRLGRVDAPHVLKKSENGNAPSSGKRSSFQGVQCRLSMAPLADPSTGKLPDSVQYPAPVHPTVYVLPTPFGGWFNSASQPPWPYASYAVWPALFWAFSTLMWLPHILHRLLYEFADMIREEKEKKRSARRRALDAFVGCFVRPVFDLVDYWLCLETPGVGRGMSVSQHFSTEAEACVFCAACNGEADKCNPTNRPCRPLCSKCSDGEIPGTFLCDHIAPTSNARQDYGHDYFRNRAADTFTNVPQPRLCGGTQFDFPHDSVRAVFLVGPRLIGKRTILQFAKARGFETCDLEAEVEAESAAARWERALDMFQELRNDPERDGRAPVLFGCGGTPWERRAMPREEVVRVAREMGVEVVSLLWEAQSGSEYPVSPDKGKGIRVDKKKWKSLSTLTGEGGALTNNGGMPFVCSNASMQRYCRAPSALTMHRWEQRVKKSHASLTSEDLENIGWAYVANTPESSGNPWARVFGRRIMVNMHPEEALVRILMPYRWRKGPSILWGGATKNPPPLGEQQRGELELQDFTSVQDARDDPKSADKVELKWKKLKAKKFALA